MNSKFIIRVLMCSTFIAGSGAILQSCIFDPGARTLFASEEPTVNNQPTVKRMPTVKKVAAKSSQPAFARSDNGSGGNSSSGGNSGSGGGMGGGSSSSSSGSNGGGNTGGGWNSDRRLKTQVRRIGTSPAGIPVYVFRYVWGGPLFVGTMAQDLLLIRPDAVMQTASGYYMVNYSVLDIHMASIGEGISLATSGASAVAVALSVNAASNSRRAQSISSKGIALSAV
ncbi:tail fiber domain-containing protein [Rhizobium hidalgonense]|uniref:tail fiber domain-containing protein n=1 Tax=Rhizobium hidalgonense TaxID=1538159 RepID=UPI002870C8F8|nr:tail fiber domain-containing protein [Rhizobium hidalgonense]MDR9807777.1 tail fiber domain-containing protein [Rhizobium hidalgonense]